MPGSFVERRLGVAGASRFATDEEGMTHGHVTGKENNINFPALSSVHLTFSIAVQIPHAKYLPPSGR